MSKVSQKRHIAKTFTWRILATLTTVLLAWVVSGDPMIGLQVGGWEFFAKMILYYVHERAWYKWGYGYGTKEK
jgi:uncharacterized membrane protein